MTCDNMNTSVIVVSALLILIKGEKRGLVAVV